ncbi:glycosyltransferase [Rhodovibrionaceae bacterium A322]
MKTVLFAWELGQGFGHVGRLLPLADALSRRGYRCLFAIPFLGAIAQRVRDRGHDVVQVTRRPPQSAYNGPDLVGSYGDILEACGFADPDRLSLSLADWDQLIDRVQPALMIADYAPAAQLSARGQLPVVALGDWFSLPPCEDKTFPPFRQAPPRIPEAQILQVVNAALQKRGQTPLAHLPQLLQADASFIITLDLLDSHASQRSQAVVGPLEALPAPCHQQIPTKDYFAYLGLMKGPTPKILRGLAQSDYEGSVFLRGAGPKELAFWRAKGLTIHNEPQDLAAMVAEARCVIHHGGLGTLEAVLALGRPQLFVPSHMEHQGNNRAVGPLKIGVSMTSSGTYVAKDFLRALSHLLSEQKYADNAAQVADDIARQGTGQGLDKVLNRIESLLS